MLNGVRKRLSALSALVMTFIAVAVATVPSTGLGDDTSQKSKRLGYIDDKETRFKGDDTVEPLEPGPTPEEEANNMGCKLLPGCETVKRLKERFSNDSGSSDPETNNSDAARADGGSKSRKPPIDTSRDDLSDVQPPKFATPRAQTPALDQAKLNKLKAEMDMRYKRELFEIKNGLQRDCDTGLYRHHSPQEYKKLCGSNLSSLYRALHKRYELFMAITLGCANKPEETKAECWQNAKEAADRFIPSTLWDAALNRASLEQPSDKVNARLTELRVRLKRDANALGADLANQANDAGRALNNDLNSARSQYESGAEDAGSALNEAVGNAVSTAVGAGLRQRINSSATPQGGSGAPTARCYNAFGATATTDRAVGCKVE